MLLNLDLLELNELGTTCLQVQTAPALVHLAIIGWTHEQRHECC